MRPVSKSQDCLKNPLNHVLGRESHIRVLRLLADQIEPVGLSVIAENTGLTVAGARKAVLKLLKTGYVHEIGSRRQRQYSIRSDDELSRLVVGLFEAERRTYVHLISSLREAISNLELVPESVWIEPVTDGNRTHIELGFLASVSEVTNLKKVFRRSLYTVESTFNLTIDLEGYTRADVATLDVEKVTMLYGKSLQVESPRLPASVTQKDMDDRAQSWAEALATLVQNDPTIITNARHWLEDISTRDLGTSAGDVEEWLRILSTYSKRQIADFLVSESPRAHRLRQSSPFPVVLSEAQRKTLDKRWEEFRDDV